MSKKTDKHSARTIIGKIVGTHGIKGTMLLLPLTDYPERFFDMTELVVEMPENKSRTLKILEIAPYTGKETLFLKVEGVTDKEQASLLKSGLITVSQDERVELPNDEYWIDDLIGLRVVEESTGKELGTLNEVLTTGSNDVFLVDTVDGGIKPIPATTDSVKKISLTDRIMTVTIPEGLWN